MRRRLLLMTGGLAATGMAASFGWPRSEPTPAIRSSISDADAAAIAAAVKPAKGEDPFAEIPWQTSLWDARTLAAKEGKPILLWEMDGHPLGCG